MDRVDRAKVFQPGTESVLVTFTTFSTIAEALTALRTEHGDGVLKWTEAQEQPVAVTESWPHLPHDGRLEWYRAPPGKFDTG